MQDLGSDLLGDQRGGVQAVAVRAGGHPQTGAPGVPQEWVSVEPHWAVAVVEPVDPGARQAVVQLAETCVEEETQGTGGRRVAGVEDRCGGGAEVRA